MMADTDIQVWLETEARTHPPQVVPYVQSDKTADIRYTIGVLAQGKSGRTRMSQGGRLALEPGQPKALGKISLSLDPAQECTISIAINQNGAPAREYEFSCEKILHRTN